VVVSFGDGIVSRNLEDPPGERTTLRLFQIAVSDPRFRAGHYHYHFMALWGESLNSRRMPALAGLLAGY
jgi:hypothetical protein